MRVDTGVKGMPVRRMCVVAGALLLLFAGCSNSGEKVAAPIQPEVRPQEPVAEREAPAEAPAFAASPAESPVAAGPPVLIEPSLDLQMRDGLAVLRVLATAKDAYGDDAEVVAEWRKNDDVVGEGLELSGLRRDDRVKVAVRAYDGNVYSEPYELSMTIDNSPPTIRENPAFEYAGGVYRHEFIAEDPDGDEVTLTLSKGPEGMVLDGETGVGSWAVPAEFVGKAEAAVEATDGHGGATRYEFTVTVSEEPPAKTP